MMKELMKLKKKDYYRSLDKKKSDDEEIERTNTIMEKSKFKGRQRSNSDIL